jgi:exonuclease III
MKIMGWNCMGLACAPTIRIIRAIVRIYIPDVLFFSETKVPSSRYWSSLFRMGFSSWLQIPLLDIRVVFL